MKQSPPHARQKVLAIPLQLQRFTSGKWKIFLLLTMQTQEIGAAAGILFVFMEINQIKKWCYFFSRWESYAIYDSFQPLATPKNVYVLNKTMGKKRTHKKTKGKYKQNKKGTIQKKKDERKEREKKSWITKAEENNRPKEWKPEAGWRNEEEKHTQKRTI